MEVWIKTLTGASLQLLVSPYDSVFNVKFRIQRLEGGSLSVALLLTVFVVLPILLCSKHSFLMLLLLSYWYLLLLYAAVLLSCNRLHCVLSFVCLYVCIVCMCVPVPCALVNVILYGIMEYYNVALASANFCLGVFDK